MRENDILRFKTRTEKEVEVIAYTTSDYYGFTHHIDLYFDGLYFGGGRARWINRTWETFRYETAINDCIITRQNEEINYLKEQVKNDFGKLRWSKTLDAELEKRAVENETLKKCMILKQAVEDYEQEKRICCEKWARSFEEMYDALSDETKDTIKNSGLIVETQEQAEQVLATARIIDLLRA